MAERQLRAVSIWTSHSATDWLTTRRSEGRKARSTSLLIQMLRKAFLADFRHRALRHHAEGIFLAEKLFGVAIVNSEGNQVPVRHVGEQHVKEDLGHIPTAQDWLLEIKPQRWMYGQRLGEETPTIKEAPL